MIPKSAVILCGGLATRFGSFADDIPKALMQVYGKPILWYLIARLIQSDFDRIILPLGHLGEKIVDFVESQPIEFQKRIMLIETGASTPIAQRLLRVKKHLPDEGSFFLINGDTYFDFDIDGMLSIHEKNQALATFAVGHVRSSYGLFIERAGVLVDFRRNSEISNMILTDEEASVKNRSYVFTGFTWLRTKALNKTFNDFEEDLYPDIIREGRCELYKISNQWRPIDTAKELAEINSDKWVYNNIQTRYAKQDLKQRYSYKSRYYSDPELLKEQILNKTVIPHQLEVQPGPASLTSLCWMKCPYCYGLSSEDSGERLSLRRYLEVLQQAVEGGVRKFIFAGYATDPLNYKHIDELHNVVLKNNAISGFHTKAIKISDALVEQITNKNIRPQSYFSISVDAGNNETYNIVHGVDSVAKVYDRVIKNINRITSARTQSGAPLDISATYLINDHNNSTEEVIKSINDLRSAGVDLIRFTFPQEPRGFDEAENSSFVPKREDVLAHLERLTPVIERENSEKCQVIIMDLDDDFSIVNKERTLPCFARFLFPSIGFDGYLAHCSESAAPHFREMSLANLETTDFWDAFYDYPADGMLNYLRGAAKKMNKTGCRCDRKEHVVNQGLSKLSF